MEQRRRNLANCGLLSNTKCLQSRLRCDSAVETWAWRGPGRGSVTPPTLDSALLARSRLGCGAVYAISCPIHTAYTKAGGAHRPSRHMKPSAGERRGEWGPRPIAAALRALPGDRYSCGPGLGATKPRTPSRTRLISCRPKRSPTHAQFLSSTSLHSLSPDGLTLSKLPPEGLPPRSPSRLKD